MRIKKILTIVIKMRNLFLAAGIVLLILYLILKHLLSADVFLKADNNDTIHMLRDILHKTIWVSTLALGLGIGGYIISFVLKHGILKKRVN